MKTKPTQHSVKELRAIGIQPDILICRSEHPIDTELKDKIALFCDVEKNAVISAQDAGSIYEVPLGFADQGVDGVLCGCLPGPAGHLDGNVHHHLVVAQRHRDVLGDRVRQLHLVRGRDQHHPGGAEAADLVAQVGRRLAGSEADALGEGVVNEAHASIFCYMYQ